MIYLVAIQPEAKADLENEKSSDVWEQKNEALHGLGLCTIPFQNELSLQ